MESTSRTYIAIDLKSFYASVECVERGLNPLTTNLVVADESRTEKTICLAVSPSLKSYGIPGRPRLFEVIQRVDYVNYGRKLEAPYRRLTGKSVSDTELKTNPRLAVDYIIAPPRMAYYIEYSTRIYNVYLKYFSADDIHVYSIDEVFIDATDYLALHKMTAHQLAMTMIRDVLKTTCITATAGIGTNMYLCKIAMDIVAKHIPPDADGVRIAELDEMSYRRQLWNHRPLTDFWRIGRGIARKLEYYGMHTMGDVARQSVKDEEILYKIFGINAELLIDHAWGWEPCTIDYVKKYKPETNSISSGQVLSCAYDTKKARVVVREMTDAIALSLVEKHLVTDQIVLTISYDAESLTNPNIRAKYTGETTTDRYGRQTPKHAHGTANLDRQTSSSRLIVDATMNLYDKIINQNLLVRYINVTASHVIDESKAERKNATADIDLFTDYDELEKKSRVEEEALAKEHKMQETIIDLKRRFGKNAILKGTNFEDGATAIERNKQIGGHKA
ncbi:MAG: DNA methylase [Bacteroidia bacterium]|nr:DNA methylase [Bacteroidia bacterium]